LKSEVERGGPRVALDLEELDLVDIEGVRFLNACESAGVSILHCSPYIREWMLQREADRKTIRNLDDSLKLKRERRIFMKKIYGL